MIAFTIGRDGVYREPSGRYEIQPAHFGSHYTGHDTRLPGAPCIATGDSAGECADALNDFVERRRIASDREDPRG